MSSYSEYIYKIHDVLLLESGKCLRYETHDTGSIKNGKSIYMSYFRRESDCTIIQKTVWYHN